MDERYVIEAECPDWENPRIRYFRSDRCNRTYWTFVSTKMLNNAAVFRDIEWANMKKDRLARKYPGLTLNVVATTNSHGICKACGKECRNG